MVTSLAAAAPWLRVRHRSSSATPIFSIAASWCAGLAAAPGDLVIAYDREWRELWTRRFADPLSDAETFRIDAAGHLLEIGGKTTRSKISRGNIWAS